MENRNKIKCNTINYRKGLIEVSTGIHDSCINIEAWNINPDVDISDLELDDSELPENTVVGNTELELNLDNAKKLLNQLKNAIETIERTNSNV